MCGRYTLSTSAKKIQDRFHLLAAPTGLVPRYNIAPTQQVLTVPQSDSRHAVMMRWGMGTRSDPRRIILNARAENLFANAFFRSAARSGRCLVVADGFYEWRRDGSRKVPFHIRMRSREPFAFAGISSAWPPDGGQCQACAVITTTPSSLVAPIHDRMPVILNADGCDRWLDSQAEETPQLADLLTPFDAAEMEAVEVSDLVNRVGNDGPQLLEERRTEPHRSPLQLRLLPEE